MYKNEMKHIVLPYYTMRYSRFLSLMAIQPTNVPLCKTCKFYRPHLYTSFESTLSDCTAVGTRNVVTGKIDYESASSCRRKECGVEGKLYEPETDTTKEIRHNLIHNSPILLNVMTLCIITYRLIQ